jgi:Flp pilus assembly pilin Flp
MNKKIHIEHGQTMAEYAVMLGVITAGLLLAFTTLGSTVTNAIDSIVGLL